MFLVCNGGSIGQAVFGGRDVSVECATQPRLIAYLAWL